MSKDPGLPGWDLIAGFGTAARRTFNFCTLRLGKKLLALLHLLYSLVLILKLKYGSFRASLSAVSKGERSEYELVRCRVGALKKVPSHLVLVIGSETVSYADVVKIIEWCLPAGIPVISLYDYRNGIDSNVVFESVCKLAKSSVQNIKWGKSFIQAIKEESKKQINGYSWKPKLMVNIYRREDGLEHFLDIVGDLHESGLKSVDQSSMNSHLSKWLSAPDPELVVVCGQHCFSSYGLLPWQLRITQFLSLDTHWHVTVEKYLNLLDEYSNCEQRYGK